MVQVIFQAIGNNFRLGIGRQGESRKKIDIQKLPTEKEIDVIGDGVFVTAVDISFEGGKPLDTVHAWTNTQGELKIGSSVLEGSTTVGHIRITKEG